jgi:hypothetical protein
MKSFISLGVAFLGSSLVNGAPIDELVTSIPLMNNNSTFDFRMFSGFIKYTNSSK